MRHLRVRLCHRVLLASAVFLVGYGLAVGQPSVGPAAIDDETDSIDRDYSDALTRVPPTEPRAALDTFQIEPGFRLELAAAEPQLADPVAAEFDEHGRLLVVEMRGYSENDQDKLGQIRLLEDADRDGEFEKSTVFADGLLWPTAIACYDGGVFVGDAPDIVYFKDTDGDGQADERRVVFTGFGRTNVQGLLNSFRWGLDNRIHVAVSSCGAELRRADRPDEPPLVLRGRNFAFNPRTLEVEATSGASQHGMSFDPWGRQFTCSNSNHIQQILIDDRQRSRNPFLQPAPALASIAVEGPAADVFRISPVEPWRIVRTRLRVKGIVKGSVEGGGRAAGYFTSATGVTIYTGDAWPAEYEGNAFIGDVGSNLVHRKVIEQSADAVPLVARRATPKREFLASRDMWFRPVQFVNAPDGNLYILDMYREIIEHPISLPPVIKKHLDLTSGNRRGRIYRVASTALNSVQAERQRVRTLPGEATDEQLAAMLVHPNGWHRTTAARLLWEQQPEGAAAIAALLLTPATRAEGRVQVLATLDGLGALDGGALAAAMQDRDARVRAHAVGVAGRRLAAEGAKDADDAIVQGVLKAAEDESLEVRFRAAMALGELDGTARAPALVKILKADAADDYARSAALSSLNRGAGAVFQALAQDDEFAQTPAGRSLLAELARQIGARGAKAELAAAASVATGEGALARELLVALLKGAGPRLASVRHALAELTGGKSEPIVAQLGANARETAEDESADPQRRAEAAAALSLSDYRDAAPTLAALLEPQQPQDVQLAAVRALGQFDEPAIAEPLLGAWTGMSPAVRQQATQVLLGRAELAKALLGAIEAGRLSARELDPATVQRLNTHADAQVREAAGRVLEQSSGQREEVVEKYRGALKLAGDVDRGREVFRKNCSACHRRDGFGTEVGADLATVVGRTPEALLISILDPNREVDPKYVQYTILTIDGVSTSGMIAAETATSVTLTRAEKVTETIVREDIDVLQSTGLTLMPEGFEKEIDEQGMADLIAFLRHAE